MLRKRGLSEEEMLDVLSGNSDIEENEENDFDLETERVGSPEMCIETGNRLEKEMQSYEENDVPVSGDFNFLGLGLEQLVDIDGPSDVASQVIFIKEEQIEWKPRMSCELRNDGIAYVQPGGSAEVGTPYSYFTKYFPSDFFTSTAHYTNVYAIQNGHSNFKPCTVAEIRILFAQYVMMSCIKFPRVLMYFDNRLGLPFFYENMQVKRFLSLRQHLHLVDNLARPSTCKDRLYKVRPIIEAVRNRLLELPLEENLCVDEQIVPLNGKFLAKQYVKGIPCPWGIKIFFLCGKSGIPYDFIVYQGSTTPLNQLMVNSIGSGSTIVLELAKRIPQGENGHKLFFDNYFPSYQLFEILLSKKILAAATIRINLFSNPPLPDAKEMSKRGRGASAQCCSEDGKVIITRWFDNKVVNLASNFVGVGVEDKARRWNKETNQFIEVKRPEVVRLYNECMGGADHLDQMVQYYRIKTHTSKWTVRVIMYFIDLAITAAWMEYKKRFY